MLDIAYSEKRCASYQVGGQPQEVGDPLVFRGLIPTAGLDKHSDLGGWGIVLQGGNHQTTGESGHLDGTHTDVSLSISISDMSATKNIKGGMSIKPPSSWRGQPGGGELHASQGPDRGTGPSWQTAWKRLCRGETKRPLTCTSCG